MPRIEVSVTCSLMGSADAVQAATGDLIAHTDGKVNVIGSAGHALMRPLGNPVHYGAVRLLAGIGAALGLLVPSRSRVAAMRA